jgi:glycosyltransferase involved in cell wall biosynthesis
MLARALADRGHEVTWWISNFEHRSKTFRQSGWLKDVALPESVRIHSVPSSAYSKNISFARIKYEYIFGINFYRLAEKVRKPDVIVLADPSLFFSPPVVRYAKRERAKLVLDVLDLWPEQFQVALPKFLKPLGRLVFAPLFLRRNRLVKIADAFVAVTKDHLSAVNPDRNKPRLVSYLGVDIKQYSEDLNKSAPESVINFIEESQLTVIYAGTLGEAYDLSTLIEAVKYVIKLNNKIKFIFAGDGPFAKQVELVAEEFPDNVLYLGRISANDLPAIYKHCQIGVCSYSKYSTVTMPVKFYDYLAGGLFILYSIFGEIHDLLVGSECGSQYESECPEALARLILLLAHDQKFTHNRSKSIELASRFDESVQHNRFAKLIEDL